MAGSQTGLFEGQSPFTYNASNPIILFLFQVVIILLVAQLVHIPLSRLRQPKVVSEVVGGLVLGPSVLGHIPGYLDTLFPKSSIPVLTNTSTLGLIFLLFLVGLETDLSVISTHWKPSLAVAAAGILVPFGFGAAISVGLYKEFEQDSKVSFGIFVLFIGLAMAITAFPIMARILMETNLLSSPVGVIAMAAGVANDVVGWTLLALCVTLAQAKSGAVAGYMVLCCLAWILFMAFAVRPVLARLLQGPKTETKEPTERDLAIICLLVLVSSLFTAMIDIHPIFGAFLAGMIMPKSLTKSLTKPFSPLIYNVLLPPFFALSGINTNISSLRTGIAWAYVIAVILLALVGKAAASFLAAKACGIRAKESLTIGVLMSCKGIIELIALNIGLQAGVISEQTFTMLVIMAIVLTGATQPLVLWIFPESRRDPGGDIYSKRGNVSDVESGSNESAVKAFSHVSETFVVADYAVPEGKE